MTFYDRQYELAFLCFILAGMSDGLDGFLARRYNCTSKFGAIADPIADKLLILSGFGIMYYCGVIPFWLLIIVCAKDAITLMGVAYVWMHKAHLRFEATPTGKVNTFLQIGLLAFALFELAYFDLLPEPWFFYASVLVATMSVLTVISYARVGIGIMRQNG